MRRALRWARAHPFGAFALFSLLAFGGANVLAYRHARALTHFDDRGRAWQGKPEGLSIPRRARALLCGVRLARPSQQGTPADLGLAFEEHTVPGEVGPLAAWYVPHPAPRGLVVLFHGFAGCKAVLLPEARAFHELGYACFLVDFRACGGSAGDTTTIGYAEAEDVARSTAYAREKWPGRPLVLFGQSMGAAAGLRALAELGVQADAAVLECPFDRLLTAVRARFRATGVPAFPGAHLLVFWGGVQHGFNGFRHNPRDYAGRVSVPVLVMHRQRDPRVSCAEIEDTYRNLAGPRKLWLFEGLGHESYVARQPGAWKEQVASFLAGQFTTPSGSASAGAARTAAGTGPSRP